MGAFLGPDARSSVLKIHHALIRLPDTFYATSHPLKAARVGVFLVNDMDHSVLGMYSAEFFLMVVFNFELRMHKLVLVDPLTATTAVNNPIYLEHVQCKIPPFRRLLCRCLAAWSTLSGRAFCF